MTQELDALVLCQPPGERLLPGAVFLRLPGGPQRPEVRGVVLRLPQEIAGCEVELLRLGPVHLNRVVRHRGEIEDLAGGVDAKSAIGEADTRHAKNAGLVAQRRRGATRGQEEFLDSGNDRTLGAARRGSRGWCGRRRAAVTAPAGAVGAEVDDSRR